MDQREAPEHLGVHRRVARLLRERRRAREIALRQRELRAPRGGTPRGGGGGGATADVRGGGGARAAEAEGGEGAADPASVANLLGGRERLGQPVDGLRVGGVAPSRRRAMQHDGVVDRVARHPVGMGDVGGAPQLVDGEAGRLSCAFPCSI